MTDLPQQLEDKKKELEYCINNHSPHCEGRLFLKDIIAIIEQAIAEKNEFMNKIRELEFAEYNDVEKRIEFIKNLQSQQTKQKNEQIAGLTAIGVSEVGSSPIGNQEKVSNDGLRTGIEKSPVSNLLQKQRQENLNLFGEEK